MADRYRVAKLFADDGKTYTNSPSDLRAIERLPAERRAKHVAAGNLVELDSDGVPTPRGRLAGVDFASDEAAELAAKLGLTAAAIQRLEQSGQNGYTVADVRRAAPTTTEE